MFTEKTESDVDGLDEDLVRDFDHSIQQRLHLGRIAVNSALSDEIISEALGRFGYDHETLRRGLALLDEAERLVAVHRRKFGQDEDRTVLINAAVERANREYSRALIVARIAFKEDTDAEQTLFLTGRRKTGTAGWVAMARRFYDHLLARPDWLARMERYRYNAERLKQEASLVETAAGMFDRAMSTNSPEFRHALQRDARLEELEEWLTDFKDIAFVAMEDRPQLLEKLGYLVV